MSEFDADTAVTPDGAGRFTAEVSERWNVGRAPNGGYLAAIGARAMAEALPHPHPFSVTTHYLRPPQHGSLDVLVEEVRTGRGHSTGSARLVQDGREVARMLGVFGDLGDLRGPTMVVGTPPDLPAPEGMRSSVGFPGLPEVARRFDLRIDPAHLSGMGGEPSGSAEIGGWLRFVDGRDADPLSLVLIADAMPPPVVNLARVGWVPTLELTVHVRAVPAPGWLQARFRTRYLMAGYLEEDGEIWDSHGTLVALSRQLARVHDPR